MRNKMKKASFLSALFLVFCLPVLVHAQGGAADIGQTTSIAMPILTSFFEALRNGDVHSLKNCMGGELYEKRKVLIEQNKGYPDFLRQLYQGVKFNIDRIDQENNGDILVDISVDFEDGRASASKLLLSKNNVGNYEIVSISEE
jgi:hypothetical protein